MTTIRDLNLTPEVREALIRSVVGSMSLSGLDVPMKEARALFARVEEGELPHFCATDDCPECRATS